MAAVCRHPFSNYQVEVSLNVALGPDCRMAGSLVGNIDPVGDEANGIAEIVVRIFDEERAPLAPEFTRDVTRIGNLAVSILESAMDALEERYVDVSFVLRKRTEDMRAWFRSSLRRLSTCATEDAPNVKHRTDMVCISISLEREQMA
jgi:phosphate uptake regulator